MPAFSWSKSRDGAFRRCLRLYYLQYYGSAAGSRPTADPEARELFIMRHLTSRPQWVGSAVHEEAQRIVTGARLRYAPTPDQVAQRLRRKMVADWEASRQGAYRSNPAETVGLLEHYYGSPPKGAAFEADLQYAEKCVRNVYRTLPYQLLASDPEVRILETETLRRVDLSGLTVYVVLDLALRLPDGRIAIVDWKTGSEGSAATRLQLAVYALYATRRYSVRATEVATWEISLSTAQRSIHPTGVDAIAWAEGYIKQSAEQMQALLADRGRNLAQEADFPMTEDHDLCWECNFRRACRRMGPAVRPEP